MWSFLLFPLGPARPQQGARVAAASWQSSQRGGEVCQGEGRRSADALEGQDGHHPEGGEFLFVLFFLFLHKGVCIIGQGNL